MVGTREGAGIHGESVAGGRVISGGAWRRTGYTGGIWFIRAYNRTENELESSRFSIRGSGLPRPSTGSGDETVEVLSGWYGLMNRYPRYRLSYGTCSKPQTWAPCLMVAKFPTWRPLALLYRCLALVP